ncbi:hypothetical protein, partial [Streptomyces alkaliterrae]
MNCSTTATCSHDRRPALGPPRATATARPGGHGTCREDFAGYPAHVGPRRVALIPRQTSAAGCPPGDGPAGR